MALFNETQKRTEDNSVVRSTNGKFTTWWIDHPVESSLVFETKTEGSALREFTPVEIKSGDRGLKNIPVYENSRALVGRLYRKDEKTFFYVMPDDELRKILKGKSDTEDAAEEALDEDLDILVRSSWTAPEQSFYRHRTEKERDEFTKIVTDRGAKFVQMSVDTGHYTDAVWGIDHVVYPFENFATTEFLSLYLERRCDKREPYDFNHRGGHPRFISLGKRRA